jgi:hypothetical protein
LNKRIKEKKKNNYSCRRWAKVTSLSLAIGQTYPKVKFTVGSLPETSRFLSNAIHCPVFHRIYLPPIFFLCLSFLLQQLMTGEGGFVYIFFSFWMCFVFKTHSVPTGNKSSCGKMGPQLMVCTKHCILNNIKSVNNETKLDRKTYSPMFLKTNTKKRGKQQPDKKHRGYLWIVQCRLKKVE